MKQYSLDDSLSIEDMRQAQQSMERANAEIAVKMKDRTEATSFIVWVGDAHLHKAYYTREEAAKYGFHSLPKHYQQSVSTRKQFELALYEIQLLKEKPDLIIFGGDMVEYGFREEYHRFYQLIHWIDIPHYYILGNHEHGNGLLAQALTDMYDVYKKPYWPEITDKEGLYYCFIHHNIKFICIDRLDAGYLVKLPQRQMLWLQEELFKDQMPTFICSHRPPLPIGNWIDDKFPDIEFWSLIDQMPHVIGVLSGHHHAPKLWSYRAKMYMTFPSTAYSIGASTGWGGMIYEEGRGVDFFIKELSGEGFDSTKRGKPVSQKGKCQFLQPEPFENSPLLNPELWPRFKE